jgi:hypothetical protein
LKAHKKKYNAAIKLSHLISIINKTCFKKDFLPEVKVEAQIKVNHQDHQSKINDVLKIFSDFQLMSEINEIK